MSKTKVTFVRNVKFAGQRYAAGDAVDVNADDFDALDAAKVISYNDKPVKETAVFDFNQASESELLKVKNDDLKAYLTSQDISFNEDAKKAELVHLILASQQEQDDEVVVVSDGEGEDE